MTDHALPLIEIGVTTGATRVGRTALAAPTAGGAATAWGVHASNLNGDILATYDTALVTKIRFGVDVPAQAIFRVPIDATDVSLLVPNFDYPHEVKIYRNGQLLFWGPVVSYRADSQTRTYEFTAYDPLWYLLHRYIGQANRHNYLGDDLVAADWTSHGSISFKGDDTTRYITGPSSIQLSGGTGGEDYVSRTFTATATTIGLALIVTGWAYLDPDFAGIAADSNGLTILRQGAVGAGARANMQITAETPRGVWQRFSAAVLMPANATEVIEVRLYDPQGEINWDGVTVTIEESVSLIDANSPGGTGWDQVQIAQQVMRYASGAWAVGPSYRKSDLNIGVAGALSGITKDRTYQFFDHQPIYEGGTGGGALDEWCKAADGFDFRMDVTISTRTFRTYYPAVGVVWDPDVITFTWVVNTAAVFPEPELVSIGIVAWDWAGTMEGAATDVCELGGWGSGAGREEGAGISDPGNRPTLELVEAAPNEAPVDLLDSIAQGRANQLGFGAVLTPVLTIVEPKDPVTQEVLVPLIGVLMPGDIFTVDLEDGDVFHTGLTRATEVEISGDDVLTVAVIFP